MRIQAFVFVWWPVTIYFICLSVICNENFIQPQWTRNVLSLHILKSKKLLLLGNWSNTKKMSEILSRWAMFMWRGKVHTLGTLIIVIPLVPFLAQHLWHMFLILSLQSRKFYLCTSVFRVGPFYPGGSAVAWTSTMHWNTIWCSQTGKCSIYLQITRFFLPRF